MTDWAAWTGGRGRVLAGAAVVTALLLSFHGAVPNRVGGLGSLLESFLPWLGAVVAVLFVLAVVRRSAFALVALLAPANRLGSVTGVVGAAGGLGGFVPPLVMGSLYGTYGSYALGLLLLGAVAAAALTYTATRLRRTTAGR